MPRIRVGVKSASTATSNSLAEKLAAELKSDRDYGQPLVYEQEYATKKCRVTVIWDEWADVSLEERSVAILRAYELADGANARDKIALASGLTVPEATAAGMLPFRVITGLRKTDPVSSNEVRMAMLEQGASELDEADGLQLRFATREEAEACRERLIRKLPASEPIWIISRDIHVQDYLSITDSAESEVT
jgi:hypothetical protein